MIREANAAWDGGEYAALTYNPDRIDCWTVETLDHLTASGEQYGRQWIPGDGKPLDATAVARRLLAEFREATANQRSKRS